MFIIKSLSVICLFHFLSTFPPDVRILFYFLYSQITFYWNATSWEYLFTCCLFTCVFFIHFPAKHYEKFNLVFVLSSVIHFWTERNMYVCRYVCKNVRWKKRRWNLRLNYTCQNYWLIDFIIIDTGGKMSKRIWNRNTCRSFQTLFWVYVL